jgi:hypothetical protein
MQTMSWFCLNAVGFAADINTSYLWNELVPTHLRDSQTMKQPTRQYMPLRPLAELYRIVAKADSLMTLCDQLEASLITTANACSKILGALLHKALEPVAEIADA